MRILLVVHRFFPEHRAGVETYTWQLARQLGARGHRVRVLTARKVISLEAGTGHGSEVDGLDVLQVTNNLVHDDYRDSYRCEVMEQAFRRELGSFAPDLVHVQHLMHWSPRLAAIAAEEHVPSIATLHDFWLTCGRMGQLIDSDGERCPGPSDERCAPCLARTDFCQPTQAAAWIGRLTRLRARTGLALDEPLRAAQRLRSRLAAPATETSQASEAPASDLQAWAAHYQLRREDFLDGARAFGRIVTPSRTVREAMLAAGLDAEQVVRLPQGLDHAPFEGLGPKPLAGPLRLGFFGTLAPHKGVHILLEAFERLAPGAASLHVHGPDDHHPEYAASLRELAQGMHGVAIGAPLDRPAVRAFLSRVDLLCVPSLWNECCPLTIQEAAIAGVPSLVSGIGGMAELVREGVDGRHAAPGDVDDWARVLGELVEHPERVPEMAAELPRVPTLEEHVAALEQHYRALLDAP